MEISGRAFVVSGGASGLGEATARLLAASGGKVIVADMNAEPGNRVASEIGADAKFVQTDVTNEDQVHAAIDAANAEDPTPMSHGGITLPKELLHGRLMTAWLERLDPGAGEPAHLAAGPDRLSARGCGNE